LKIQQINNNKIIKIPILIIILISYFTIIKKITQETNARHSIRKPITITRMTHLILNFWLKKIIQSKEFMKISKNLINKSVKYKIKVTNPATGFFQKINNNNSYNKIKIIKIKINLNLKKTQIFYFDFIWFY
jgi:hypothetical protein